MSDFLIEFHRQNSKRHSMTHVIPWGKNKTLANWCQGSDCYERQNALGTRLGLKCHFRFFENHPHIIDQILVFW